MVSKLLGIRTGLYVGVGTGTMENFMAGGWNGMKMESLLFRAIIDMVKSMGNGGSGMRMDE
jgi:hypothetical protein